MAKARRTTFRHLAARRCAAAVLLALTVLACGGCGGRFVTRTEFLAPGFTRAALRGRTVAVVPPAEADGREHAGELAGVVTGMREAGARVRVLPGATLPASPAYDAASSDGDAAMAVAAAGRVAMLADFADPYSDAAGEAARRWGRDADTRYLLVVHVTDSDVIRRFEPRAHAESPGAETAARSTGRRVGLRLALVRLSDTSTLWVASGTGEAWEAGPPGPGGAATADEDVRAGNLPLYPPPPPPQSVAARLTRRLIARVPSPTELEPS